MDPEIVSKIESAVQKMSQNENFLALSKKCDQVIDFKTSAEVTAELHDGYEAVGELIKAAGIA